MKVLSFSDAEVKEVYGNNKIKKRIVLSSNELGNITQLAQAIFPPGEKANEHYHDDMAEIFIVQSGNGIIRIDDKNYELKENICAIVEPNEVHQIINSGGRDLIVTFLGINI